MIICTCIVCGCKWGYNDETDIDVIRATASPCGHQGLFKVEDEKEVRHGEVR